MTLLEYIASLQDQGLSDKEIFDKAQEWKKNNPPVEDKVVDDVIDEAKTKGGVYKTDATASPKQPDASETSSSDVVYGNGDLKYQERDLNPYEINELSKYGLIDSPSDSIKFEGVDLNPGETKTTNGWDFKYEIDENKEPIIYTKKSGSEEWLNTNLNKKNNPAAFLGAAQEIGFDVGDFDKEDYFESLKKISDANRDYKADFDVKLELSENDLKKARNFNLDNIKSQAIIMYGGKEISRKSLTKKQFEEIQKSSGTRGGSVKWVNPNWEQEVILDQNERPLDLKIIDETAFYKLNKSNIYEEFKDKPYSGKYAGDFREDAAISLLNNEFDFQSLSKIENFNVNNFLGWMNQKGYTNDFLDNIYDPNQGYDIIKFSNNASEEDKRSSEINRQRKANRYLNLYLEEQEGLYQRKIFLNYIKKNPSEFKNIKNLDQAYAKAREYFRKKYNNAYGFFDYNKIKEYEEYNFPQLTEDYKQKNTEVNNKINAIRKNENLQSDLYLAAQNFKTGFFSGAQNIALGLKDIFGIDTRFEESLIEERDLKESQANVRYQYVEGKLANVDGIDYIEDDNGGIYDITNKTILANVTEGEFKKIKKALQDSKKRGSSFSGLGSLQQFSAVTGRMAFDIAATYAGGRITKFAGLGAKGKKIIGLSKPSFDAMVYYSASGYMSTKTSTYRELVNYGINENDAQEISDIAARYGGALLGATSIIAPNSKYINNFERNVFGKNLISRVIEGYNTNGKAGAFSNIVGFFKNIKPTKATFVSGVKGGFQEFAQENIQQLSEYKFLNKYINQLASSKVLKEDYSQQDFINTSVLAFSSGSILSNINLRNLSPRTARQQLEDLYTIGLNESSFLRISNDMVAQGIATTEQVQKALSQARAIINQSSKIPNGISSKAQLEGSILQQEIEDLQRRKKQQNEVYHPILDKKINDKKKDLAEILKPEIIKLQSTAGARLMAKQLEAKFEIPETSEEYEKRFQQIKDQGGEVQDSTSYGQSIILNGEKIILINLQAAAEDFVFTTSQHEILHPFFRKTFEDNPELAIRFGKTLISEIVNNADILITNNKLESRLRNYLEDPNYSAAATWEEVVPLVSEAMSNRDIVYNEKTKGFFENLIDLFNNLFRSGKQPLNVTFDKGVDIFNFLKDYNKTIESGKGFSEAQLAIAREGAKGALVEGDIEIDKKSEGAKAVERLDKLMKDETKQTDTAAKESKRDSGVEASSKVQQIYDTRGIAGAFDIIEQFKPIVGRIVDKRRDAPNFDRQLLTDEIETGERGLFDLIREYKPESGVPLAAYINKFLPARAIEASKRVLGEEFVEDVTEAKGVMAEEVVTEVSEKPVTTLIKPSSLISNDAVAKIKENIASKIKGIDPEQMTFKKLGDLAPEIIAQEIGIPVKKLTDPTANLSKGDANAIQRFVNKNADKLLKILPEGAVVEAATDKLLGTSTGVPKGLLNAFYTKKPRITKGAGLSPFALNKGITKADFLKTFGIVEGKKAEDFSARSSEAQALKGIANLYGRLVTNEIVRSETDLSLEVKQDIAAGKSKSMASKRITPENLEELKGLSILRSKTDLAKSLRYNSPSINEQNRKTIQDQIQEAVEKYGLDTATLRAGMMGSGGRQIFRGKIVDGKFVKGKKGTIGVEKYVKTTDGRYFLEKSAEGSLSGEITNWVAKPGRLYYGNQDPAYIKLIQSTKEYKGKKPIKINIKNAFTDKAKVQSEINMDVLDHVVNQLTDAVANGMSLDVAGTIIVQSYQATSGLIKIAAPFLYRSNTMEYAGKGSKPEQRKGEKYREEHNPPASVVGAYIMWAIKNNKAQPIMQAIRDNYYQTQLSKKDDFLLDMAKLDSTLPEGFTIFDNPIVRLAAAGIDLNTITNPYTGKTMAESVNAGIPLDVYNSYNESQKLEAISYQNEQIIKAISDTNYNPSQTIKAYLPLVKGKAMASKRNSDLIPDSIKYDKAITVKTSIDALSKADKALNNARKLNAPVKKIRVFDFDDTLARTNSRVIYTMPNFEGGFSPESVRQKAIFMVGGPGAGKTNIGKGLKLGRQGYKVVNQDIALEVMKAEAGLPAKEAEYTTEQISTRAKLGAAARKAAIAKFDKYAANGDGMVIDGTGASYPATMKKVKQLQDVGYEVHMVVANTSLETALARNKARVERSLPDFIVERSWNQVQESTELYRKDFGDKLYEINTEEIGFGEDLPQDFLDRVYAGINSNIQGKLEAGTFAEQATDLEAQGAEWNFSEFSKVIDGKEGPLFKVAKIIADKRGAKDIFVLTARPADAAKPIQQFLKSLGLNIPIKNITGLGDGAAEAKARWIMDKASEGYNDFYFADDVTGNVKAVEEVLSQIDVKSKVQQAKASKRQDFDRVINDMIFDTTGIETYKKYSAAKARTVGAGKGKYNFFIPAGAEDLTGLLYKMLGKGKKGDAQMAFLKQNLLDTYNRSEISVTQAKIAAMNDFIALKTQLKTLPKTLNKQTGIGKFNYSHAIRVFIWQSQGVEIPGLSKKDIQDLVSFVESDPKLKVFAEQLSTIQKDKPYPLPSDSWLAGTISSDIINDINTIKRAEYQQEFRENVDIIFSEENLNKMEAAYGTNWRAAVEDSIRRMKSGSNRPKGGDSTTQGILDWLNNSVGAVMFLNTRSALLQTISSVNFINWSDNNIFKAGLAFANQKQFWKDFITLMNSDYLVERRNGLKINISESEIADAAANSKNKATAVISYILNKGFVMTQFADSFAIASGGSTFYRNRIKSLVKSGMDPKLAEQRAFEDFRAIAEESQQSSNPVRISKQQASTAGRVILAWANTSMQYARIQKRAIQDLVNGRGNAKANVSKIIYYGIVQNLLFNTLQSAIDAIGFGDDDDDEKEELKNKRKEKAVKVANGMLDSQLRGLGITGAAVSSLKNFLLTLMEENDKKRPEYEEAVEDLFAFSPPLGSKVQKIYGGLRSFSWNKKEMKEKGWSLDNPAYLAVAQIFTGLTNVPVDRVVKKINNIRGIFSELSARWQKIALALGWSTYDVGLPYYGGFDAVEPLTPEEEAAEAVKLMMDQTNTAEQKQMLEELGLTKAEIKELKYEENRVNKIIELKNKPIEKIETKKEVESTKKEVKPKEKVKPKEEIKPKKLTAEQRLQKQFDSIKAENKPDQVKTLTNFGLSKKEIRALKYEEDRVNKILELMSKKQ